jgi:hypothetical protein
VGDKIYGVCGTFISCRSEVRTGPLLVISSSGFRTIAAQATENLFIIVKFSRGSRCRFPEVDGAPAMALGYLASTQPSLPPVALAIQGWPAPTQASLTAYICGRIHLDQSSAPPLRSLPLPSRLPQPHAGTATVFVDEFDPGFFQGDADRHHVVDQACGVADAGPILFKLARKYLPADQARPEFSLARCERQRFDVL